MSPRHTPHLDTDQRDPLASVPPALEAAIRNRRTGLSSTDYLAAAFALSGLLDGKTLEEREEALTQVAAVIRYVRRGQRNSRVPDRELVVKAFLAGFTCSCEGFNGECAFEHLAPPLFPSDEEIESNRDLETLMKLAEEVAARFAPETQEPDTTLTSETHQVCLCPECCVDLSLYAHKMSCSRMSETERDIRNQLRSRKRRETES